MTADTGGLVRDDGIGTACFHYVHTLARAGYEVEVLFAGESGEGNRSRLTACYRSFGVRFQTMDELSASPLPVLGSRWHVKRAQRIFDYLRQHTYDYIVFEDRHANGFWAVRAKQMGIAFRDTPIAVVTLGPHQWQKQGMRTFGAQPLEDSSLEWAEKETIAAADILISPSRHMVQWLNTNGYKVPSEVVVCPIPVERDPHWAAPSGGDPEHLVFFGRTETTGGLRLLGGALRQLKSRGSLLPRKVSCLGELAQADATLSMGDPQSLNAQFGDVELLVKPDFDRLQALAYLRRHRGVVLISPIGDNSALTAIECITNGSRFLTSGTGASPEVIDAAVTFERSATGLRKKLEELPRLDFTTLRHPYNPAEARKAWLDHVGTVVARVRSTPQVEVQRTPVPPVSVCVPFYRHDGYLDRLIYAFLQMRLPDLQIVLVDDGTPPQERKRFDALKRELEPLGHVFHTQVNMGPGVARNKAVALARHDLLLFFDADNVPFPGLVERLASALRSASADSIAAPFAGIPPMLRMPVPEDVTTLYRPPGGPLALALVDNVLGDVCSMVRRPMVQALGGFCEERHSWEDWDFFFRAIGRGFCHRVYPDPLFYYTIDESGRNLSVKEHAHENHQNLLKSVRSILPEAAGEVAEILAAQFLVSR